MAGRKVSGRNVVVAMRQEPVHVSGATAPHVGGRGQVQVQTALRLHLWRGHRHHRPTLSVHPYSCIYVYIYRDSKTK